MKNDIRFLLTNHCNYNCYFCHNEGISSSKSNNIELLPDQYVLLYKVYSNIEKYNGVTLSGGEPFIYNQIEELIIKLCNEKAKITIVTNGSLLHLHIPSLKYINRINVSIHTMDESIYKKITGINNLKKVKENLILVRKLYPNLAIRLNITPCFNDDWSSSKLNDLIQFAKQINASIKLTELFPNNNVNCVLKNSLIKEITNLGYEHVHIQGRTELYKKDNQKIFIAQCTCSKAIETSSPVDYCRENHDLYVNHDGNFILCRIGNESINFFDELSKNNINELIKKVNLAKLRISSSLCIKHLKEIY